jgi:hypothetical protein
MFIQITNQLCANRVGRRVATSLLHIQNTSGINDGFYKTTSVASPQVADGRDKPSYVMGRSNILNKQFQRVDKEWCFRLEVQLETNNSSSQKPV